MSDAATPKPHQPLVVLAAAVLVPGSGHLLLGMPQRALTFLFFMVILGWVTLHLAPDGSSFFARHSGAILVYGFSVLDAYRIAKVRYEQWKFGGGDSAGPLKSAGR